MEPNSNVPSPGGKPQRPEKPTSTFPLYPHRGSRQWAKKILGRTHYFGSWVDDPEGRAALELYLEQRDDLEAGREPKARREDALTVEQLCFDFLGHKEGLRDAGELSPRTYGTYLDTCQRLAKIVGRHRAVQDLEPKDFKRLRAKLATGGKKGRGAVWLRNEIQRVRSLFKYAFEEGLIPAPIRYGQSFDRPSLDVVRRERGKHRAEYGPKMFQAGEIRAILAEAKQPLRTMVLLAANCAFGPSDLSNLPLRAVDLDTGWIDYPRPKTGVDRRVPLWPETIEAIRDWLPHRPKAKDKADAGLLFLTVRGARWVKMSPKGAPKDCIGQEFTRVVRKLKIDRPRVGFYALRHGFETIAGETTDQVSVDAVMGHVPTGMAAAYREHLGDDRLRRVVEHVRQWLFGGQDAPKKNSVFCDPSAPCDPEAENPEENEVFEGRKGSQAGSQENRLATLPDPLKTSVGAQGPEGSQNTENFFDGPRLRLFVG